MIFRSFGVVKAVWQAVMALSFGLAVVGGAEMPRSFAWDSLKVDKSMFTPELGMLDSEREEYATNLSAAAVSQLKAARTSTQSVDEARRMIALALHLSPRNKRAVVANFQLSKGIVPDAAEGNYSPQVFARLLLARGQLLEKQGGDENQKLARLFIHLAATMDPKNEDAVYASEVHRLDHGPVDWSSVTGEVKKP